MLPQIDYVTAVECIDSYLLVTEYCARGDLHGMLPYMDKNHVMARYVWTILLLYRRFMHSFH